LTSAACAQIGIAIAPAKAELAAMKALRLIFI
jgi:hypothetical protein